MSNLGLGLGIMAPTAGVIGFMFFRGARAKPNVSNGGGDPGGAGGWDGAHGHGHGDGGSDGGGGD